MGNQSISKELEQAIAQIHRLENAELTIRAYCKKAQLDGFQHVPIKTILELLSNR